MIKVASTSKTGGVAGAIAHTMRKEKEAKVRAIGAGAVNQAVKATILARRYLLEDEEPTSICCVPNFVEIELDGEERTAVEITIKRDNDDCDEFADGADDDDADNCDEFVDGADDDDADNCDEFVDDPV